MARSDYEHLSRDQLLTVLADRDAHIERLEARIARLEARIAQLEAHVAKLEQLLDDATRDGHRQAAPFSKGPPTTDPKTPGRKPGDGRLDGLIQPRLGACLGLRSLG